MNRLVIDAINKLESFMKTVDDATALPREAAEFVHALILAAPIRRAVEIGTSYGYSGLWIASALATRSGRLITIDHLQRKSDAARASFQAADLLEYVDLRIGTASEILRSINGPLDFVLNDADKDNCITYVDIVAPKLVDGGIILTDNTTTHARELAGFIDYMRRRHDFFTAILPVGNGMALSIKHARP
ncbi:MAG: class I SAM-dependent methyltransferase [Phycisphaerales bacterium]|nr:MAG: class I SAM-dependent methyltransferase [Phycisphaerales bacterium]